MPKTTYTDQERAERVNRFFGLDGSEPTVPPGHLPQRLCPDSAPDFEKQMRNRLTDLANPTHRGAHARELETKALEAAGLPLKEVTEGRWKIDRAAAKLESAAKEAVLDQLHAAGVRAFYGLDGGEPTVPPRYRPSRVPLNRDSAYMAAVRTRIRTLAGSESGGARAGELEAQALTEAGIRLVKRERGGWKIDLTTPIQPPATTEARDWSRATDIRALYGLDGGQAAVASGLVPDRQAPPGASKEEAKVRGRIADLADPTSRAVALDFEAAALNDAGLEIVPNPKRGWKIYPPALADTTITLDPTLAHVAAATLPGPHQAAPPYPQPQTGPAQQAPTPADHRPLPGNAIAHAVHTLQPPRPATDRHATATRPATPDRMPGTQAARPRR